MLLVCCLLGAASAGGEREAAPRLTPGIVQPGLYRVPCSLEVTPVDALALAGRPARDIAPGETGTLVRIATQVSRIDDGRQRLSVVESLPICTVRLQQPGRYEVSVHEETLHWAWLPHPEGIGLTKTPLGDRRTSTTWGVRVVRGAPSTTTDEGACDGTSIRAGHQGDAAEAVRRAVASALAAEGGRLGVEHVAVYGEGLPRFAVHLRAGDRQPRHTIDCLVREAEAGNVALPLPSALHVVFGTVEHAAGETRVTMRVTEVETSIVIAAGRGGAHGTDEQAIARAARDAAADLGFDTFGW